MSDRYFSGWMVLGGLGFVVGLFLYQPAKLQAYFYLASASHSYDTQLQEMNSDVRLNIREANGDTQSLPTEPSEPLPLDVEGAYEQPLNSDTQTYYKEKGKGLPTTMSGFGERVPLRNALFLLLPEGWKANTELVPPMNVTWQGPKPWTQILRQTARDKQVQMVVDWNHQSVDVKPLPDQALLIAEGEMLSEGLTRWAKRAGWTLAWEAPRDYPVAVTTVFGADFMTSVKSLSKTLWEHGIPLKMTLYKGNQVLGVTLAPEVLRFER